MKRLLRLLVVALVLLAGAAHAAFAGNADISYSTWTVSGSSVLLKFMLPVAAARARMRNDVPVLTTRSLGEYILGHVAVQAAGRDCPAVDQGYDLGKVDPLSVGADQYGFEILFRCPAAKGLVLHNHVLFGRAPGHVNFARIEKDGHAVDQVFTARHEELSVPDSGTMAPAGLGWYAHLGWMHMLLSPDRLCFLLGSLLLIRRPREAGYLMAGLLFGYACALSVSATGWFLPRGTLLEAFIGFMVALLAALISQRTLQLPRVSALGCPALLLLLAIGTTLTHAHWQAVMLFGAALFAGGFLAIAALPGTPRIFWLLPAAIVGFLDGFVLPSMLSPLRLPQRAQLWMSLGFDLGSALTAVSSIGLALGAYALLRRRRLVLPRMAVSEIAAAGLGAFGTFWLLSRLYS